MILADMVGPGLSRRPGRHVDSALAVLIDEDLGNGARRSTQVEIRFDARARHRSTQQAPPLVVGLSSKNSRTNSKQRGPAELIQHQPANTRLHRCARGDGFQQTLLVGCQDAPRKVHPIEHHAAEADQVEIAPTFEFDRHPCLRSKRVNQDPPISLAAIALTSAKASSKRSASTRVSSGVPGATLGLEITPSP